MIKVNSNIEDFGNVMILALRYALGRRTYVTLEIPEFIMKNNKLISERVCIVMIRDINQYLKDRKSGMIIDDECDYKSWIKLNNWLYKLAIEREYDLIGV